MCTIGTIFKGNYTLTYKQCDLINPTKFYEPLIMNGDSDIRYMKFGRDGNSGSWCGINNYGVSLVAADAYITSEMDSLIDNMQDTSKIFDAYIKAISMHKSAKSAIAYMQKFYMKFPHPDIVVISDSNESFYIETFNGETICINRAFCPNGIDNHFSCTNHFRFIHGAVDYCENHSTYLRLERTEMLLSNPATNIFKILSDQYYGKSVLSICRDKAIIPKGEDAYFTQASVVFSSNGNAVNCAYIINGNPIEHQFTLVANVFNKQTITTSNNFDELNRLISTF